MNTTLILVIAAVVLMVAMHTVSHGLRRAPKEQPEAVDGASDDTRHAGHADPGGSDNRKHGCC
jgi:hypothetical protein